MARQRTAQAKGHPHPDKFTVLPPIKAKGKRHAIEPGAVVSLRGRRGTFRVHEVREWQDGRVEVIAWWRSSIRSANPQAQWAPFTLYADAVTKVAAA